VKPSGYRIWAAILHEIFQLLCKKQPSLGFNTAVKMLLEHTKSDWIEWRTEQTLRDVDLQIAAIHEAWFAEQPQPQITESESGELRIQAPWLTTQLGKRNEPPAPDQAS